MSFVCDWVMAFNILTGREGLGGGGGGGSGRGGARGAE